MAAYTLEEIQSKVASSDGIMLYFSGKSCGVCQVLKPKIDQLITTQFPKIEQIFIEAEQFPQIASYFEVFTVPTVIIFFEGKEFVKQSRHISVLELEKKINRPYTLYFDQ